jgi:predicted 2-oxoglutarate/Fe(II)-dependent dioxygenase YbiX
MVKYFPNFLTNSEVDYFMNIFSEESMKYYGDQYYKFYFVDLMNRELEVSKFKNFNFKKFRVQMVNETIHQVDTPHSHLNPWSFIIFLNENFEGGELIFDTIEFKPKIGDMVYFSGEEMHKVNNCVGRRFTLIGFMMNNPLQVDRKIIKEKNSKII